VDNRYRYEVTLKDGAEALISGLYANDIAVNPSDDVNRFTVYSPRDLEREFDLSPSVAAYTTYAVFRDLDGTLAYNWTHVDAAARLRGIDPETLKDWAFEGVTETLDADELALAYLTEIEAK
jgi:hypothetical protein